MSESLTDDIARKIGKHWSRVTKTSDKKSGATAATPMRLRWWQSTPVIREINRRVCGKPVPGFSHGLNQLVTDQFGSQIPFARAVSVGGGTGNKEMALLRAGIVTHFDLYELSTARIEEGRKLAERLDLQGRITFHEADAFAVCKAPESFDMVHWNNSLHHMFDVDAAVEWSRMVLKSGGLFYMDDFIGPDRFQWTDTMLEVASSVRAALDDRLLVNPRKPSEQLSRVIRRPNPETLAKDDPSEAVQSAKIPAAVLKHFPNAELKYTGGVIYHLVLSDVLNNIDEENDQMTLKLMMIIDDLCGRLGENHYAVALAKKI